jgi:type IV pilus assembly protein PilN
MIRTNLSTRPFYNERVVRLWLTVFAVAVLAATAFNVSRIIKYSRNDTQLATEASTDEARAADLRKQAARLRATVNPRELEFASTEARQANDLIDRRTFSWTELLNRFEATLPDEVRITSVHPRVDRNAGTVIQFNVIARSTDDVNQFIENMSANGAFTKVRPIEERTNDEGLLEASLEAAYAPTSAETPAAPTTPRKPATGGARPPR